MTTEEIVKSKNWFLACPCCGRESLTRRGFYEICMVCWWEDEGQDNAQANEIWRASNYEVSLTQGRVNFLMHGISDPARPDLRAHQEPPEKYVVGRHFALSDDGCLVMEIGTPWESQIFEWK